MAVRVTVFAPHRAVRVYVVVAAGDTVVLPGVATPPIPWSISTESALVTAPQLNVLVPPAVMDVGDAANDEMLGVPEQPADEVLDDALLDEDELAGATTLILMVTA